MEKEPVQYQLFRKIFSAERMVFRIGELSAMTGVSSRQLRYWEQKNYIQAMERGDEQAARSYRFREYARVMGIKYFQDQGYTLSASVKKINEYIDMANFVHVFVKEAIQTIEDYGDHIEIDLGWFDEATQQRLIAVQKDGKVTYKIIER
ncbi:MerR family transcriptional regulator [Periweissella fabalis]|uniref:MerR family transcriptional regulator n=1 Tax=Periweissella fabalis TaxID=1070421 RepID=A0A7X6S2T1_9LACO|nr:MerR family transcriptional regulator [Periweissella fabalis]MCM0599563.1 MerR family transcriptional regulator [Periweissella fabalis]NKZ23868.1 MerR family transcriptional regulator [Periweissella fabalis]